MSLNRAFSHIRAYVHAVIKESAACHMISVHNVAFQLRLMRNIRESIIAGKGFLQLAISTQCKPNSAEIWKSSKNRLSSPRAQTINGLIQLGVVLLTTKWRKASWGSHDFRQISWVREEIHAGQFSGQELSQMGARCAGCCERQTRIKHFQRRWWLIIDTQRSQFPLFIGPS